MVYIEFITVDSQYYYVQYRFRVNTVREHLEKGLEKFSLTMGCGGSPPLPAVINTPDRSEWALVGYTTS